MHWSALYFKITLYTTMFRSRFSLEVLRQFFRHKTREIRLHLVQILLVRKEQDSSGCSTASFRELTPFRELLKSCRLRLST
jgi:hypothetical protein